MNAPGRESYERSKRPTPAIGHMPFFDHRTVAEVWEQQEAHAQLPWCPPQYRDPYRKIRALVGGPEARRMILEQIAKDERCSGSVLVGVGRGCAKDSA